MKIITFLLLIQFGYIIAKENSRSCNDSLENDPRLKRSDEIDMYSEITEKSGEILDDDSNTEDVSQENKDTDDNLDETNNSNEKTNELEANPNSLPQKLPLVQKSIILPVNVEKTGEEINKLTSQNVQEEEAVYYQAIDPKYLIISGLSLPRSHKNVTNTSNPEDPVTVLEEMVTTSLDNVNVTEVMNATNGDEVTRRYGDDILTNDVTNIRELREHLLDHLLDYFINIIKEENLRNNTKKNNGKERMKVEEKLSNYYDPQHLDLLLEDNDDYNYTHENKTDYSASEEDLFDNEEIDKQNVTSNHSHKNLAREIDDNIDEIHNSPEESEELSLNIEENQSKSSSNEETISVNLSEPVTIEHINLIEKENDFNNALSNAKEISEDDSEMNVITTTERSFSDEDFNDEKDTVDLNYSDNVTDEADNVHDIGSLITEKNMSYEDFVNSDEFKAIKNINVNENKIKPAIEVNENEQRHNVLDIEQSNENTTSENDTIPQNLDNGTANLTSKFEKGLKSKELVDTEAPNKNVDENNMPCDDNKYKKSSKKLKNVAKRKQNKKPRDVETKNHKNSKRHYCGDSIVINLNINLE